MKRFDPQLLLPALDEAADFIIVFDDSSVEQGGPFVVYANRSFEEATGYSRSELLGKPYGALLSPNNSPQVLGSILRAINERSVNSKELLARRKNGTDFWLEFVAKPWTRNGAQYWLTIGRDITLRRQSLAQMALLFAAIEHTTDAVALYQPSPDGVLELTYENERSFQLGEGRLLSLWNAPSPHAQSIRRLLEQGTEVHEYFAELDRQGRPRLVQFNARAIRSDARIEAVVTLERLVAHAHEQRREHYESLLLRIATLLPGLAEAQTPLERFSILRAILVDAFEAELCEGHGEAPHAVHIAAGAKLARFSLDGKPMIVRWPRPLESTALTALRFCIEAAIQQSQLSMRV